MSLIFLRELYPCILLSSCIRILWYRLASRYTYLCLLGLIYSYSYLYSGTFTSARYRLYSQHGKKLISFYIINDLIYRGEIRAYVRTAVFLLVLSRKAELPFMTAATEKIHETTQINFLLFRQMMVISVQFLQATTASTIMMTLILEMLWR
jgi:hypothetical protein